MPRFYYLPEPITQMPFLGQIFLAHDAYNQEPVGGRPPGLLAQDASTSD